MEFDWSSAGEEEFDWGSAAPEQAAQSFDDQYYSGVPDSLVSFVKSEEGFSAKAYPDYNQYSIGWGSRASGPGEVIDEDEAERRLRDELSGHYRNVVTAANKVGARLSQPQLDALASFDYNTGKGGYLVESSNGDINDIASRLPQYNKAGGKVLPGLVNRRQRELALFGSSADVIDSGPKFADTGTASAAKAVVEGRQSDFDWESAAPEEFDWASAEAQDMGHGAEVPPPRPAPAYLPDDQLKGITVKLSTTDPESGETMDEEMDALDAQNMVKSSIGTYQALIDCLSES